MYAGFIVETATTRRAVRARRRTRTRSGCSTRSRGSTRARARSSSRSRAGRRTMRQAPVGCPFAPRCAWRLEVCWTDEPAARPARAGPADRHDRARGDPSDRLPQPADRARRRPPGGRSATGFSAGAAARRRASSRPSSTSSRWPPRRPPGSTRRARDRVGLHRTVGRRAADPARSAGSTATMTDAEPRRLPAPCGRWPTTAARTPVRSCQVEDSRSTSRSREGIIIERHVGDVRAVDGVIFD